MINLNVAPNTDSMSWEEFKTGYGRTAVALDGFVNEGPQWDPALPCANFNHHEGVDRLMTRATCAQVLIALRQGFLDYFKQDDGHSLQIWVNDCDEDVCTSVFALRYHWMVTNTINPAFNKLVAMEDHMDTTAGAYPYPADLPALQELNWVFNPYRIFRLNGGLESRSKSSFTSIILDVNHRILQYICGHGEKVSLDLRYNIIQKYSKWSMVEEKGLNAKTGMFSDGIRAYVSTRSGPYGNRYAYTIGRMSKFVDFDVQKIITRINLYDDALWGGGDTIGGSNRAAGSKLTPKEIAEIVESCQS